MTSRHSKRLPATAAMMFGIDGPVFASGQEIVTSARRKRPLVGRATGRLGWSPASSSAMRSTRAACRRSTRSAAAPVSFTKVAVEASPAITAAASATSMSVSMR